MATADKQDLKISPELAVGLIVAVAGFSAWLTNTSYQIGSMKTKLENSIESQEGRLSAVESLVDDHESRLDDQENQLDKIEGR